MRAAVVRVAGGGRQPRAGRKWTLLLSIATIAVAFAMLGAFRVVSSTVTRVAETWTQSAEMSVYLDDVVTGARTHRHPSETRGRACVSPASTS